MFFPMQNGIVESWQSDGNCTRIEGASNMALKNFFDMSMTELAMVDNRWTEASQYVHTFLNGFALCHQQ
eukprot:12330267-Ditylum_brightwellii.AAC.1